MALVNLTVSLVAAGLSDRTIEAIVVRFGDVITLPKDFCSVVLRGRNSCPRIGRQHDQGQVRRGR